VFFVQNNETGAQASLRTRDKSVAVRLLHARNEAHVQPALNLQIARAYLMAGDPAFMRRTWQNVMDEIQTHGRESTQVRYMRGMKSPAFDSLRNRKLLETTAEDLLVTLRHPQMSVGHYLRRLHNLALTLGWLPVPILAPILWPRLHPKPARGITLEEHLRILAAEKNAERNLFYQLLWEIGASQSDAAALTSENIDWPNRTLTYFRMKTGERAQMAIGRGLEGILNQLPTTGPLFPAIFPMEAKFRAAEFRRRCRILAQCQSVFRTGPIRTPAQR
jgi:integrase